MKRLRGNVNYILMGSLPVLIACLSGPRLIAQVRETTTSDPPLTQPIEQRAESPAQVPQAHYPGNDYVIGAEDLLKIDVFQVPDLSDESVRVTNDGTITVPLLGRVKAAGLTADQLAKELEKDWGKTYLQNPEVDVFVTQYQARPVSIMGAVQKPGLYYLTGPRNLVEVLGMAGGIANNAADIAGPMLYVTRKGGFEDLEAAPGMTILSSNEIQIQISKLLYTNDPALNIPIKPFDIISVSQAGVVYVAGEGVKKPGAFVLQNRDNVTAIQALAMAEGVTSTADKRDARIIRQGANGQRVEIPLNLERVLKGKAADPVLATNDILFIPNNAQKAAMKRALDVTVSTVSGLLIYRGL